MSKFFNKKTVIHIILSAFIVSFLANSEKVFAYDQSFYASNDILWYNPCATKAGAITQSSTAIVGNDNTEKLLRYFIAKGLTLAQASGIAGNISRESSFNPAKIEGGKIAPDNYTLVAGTGFGLAQWTDGGRQKGLITLAKSSGVNITDFGMQLNYIWQEMNTNRNATLPDIKAATTADNAAYIFHRDYEGSADTEAMVIKNRGGDALAIFAKYQLIITDASTSTTGTAAASTSTDPANGYGNTCTSTGVSTNFATNFTVYDQDDPLWANNKYGSGTIASAGCGPAAMAMIVTNLTGQKVTPADTAAYGAANGTAIDSPTSAGSNHNIHQVISDHYGLQYSKLTKDVTAINTGLSSGGLVIMSGTGSAPFTALGHFIVIRAVTADGKWLIGDSNGSVGAANSQNDKEWDPVSVLSMVDDYIWLIHK